MVDDDLSLSDLSLSGSDAIELEVELILDGEPSIWVSQDGGGALSASCRLANMAHPAFTLQSGNPSVVDDKDISVRPLGVEGGAEAKTLDYASLATVDLEWKGLCHLIYHSAPKCVSLTDAPEDASKTVTAAGDGNPYDLRELHSDCSNDQSKWLSLTATTLRSVERRFNRDRLGSKILEPLETKQSDEETSAVKLDATLRIDPKAFVYFTNLNAPKQSLEEELKMILLEHAKEASVLKDLVCSHFGQFISCKNTIVDIRRSLRREETGDALNSSATSVLVSAIDDAIHLASMEKVSHLQRLLDRQKRVEAARRALVVLKTRRVLFTLPALLQQQHALQLWEDMSRNVVSLRSMQGCDVPTKVLMKLTSACEKQVKQIEMRTHGGFQAHVHQNQDRGIRKGPSTWWSLIAEEIKY